MMKCSVVIATFNREKFLSKSINSILSQSHENIELIVVDDGSTDGTDSLLNEYLNKDSRVRYVKLDQNSGASIARNRGIAEASGDLIMVWDSDDVLYPHAISRVVEIFAEHPELAIVSSPCKQMLGNEELPYTRRPPGEVSLEQTLCKYIPSNEKFRVARANVYKQVRYQSRNIDFIVSGYLAEQGRWFHLDEELGELLMQQDSVSLTGNRKKPNINLSIQRVTHMVSYLDKFGDNLLKACPGRYAAYAYGASLGLILDNQKRKARSLLKVAIKNHPRLVRCWFVFLLTFLPGAKQILKIFFNFRIKASV